MLPTAGWLRRLQALFPLCALLAAGAFGCGDSAIERRARDPRPNILLISMDTTRADHLSIYGYPRPTSPALARLAAEGVLFESAYAPTATTGPTHATVFTGRDPMDHGVLKNGLVLGRTHETLAERLAAEDFETGAVVSSFVLNHKFGYDRGFGTYDDDFSQAATPDESIVWEGMRVTGKFSGTADDTTRRALAWLDRRDEPDQPFFLFVHYFDPHFPYEAPEDFDPDFGHEADAHDSRDVHDRELAREIDAYDREIAYTDREIGRLLRAIDAAGFAPQTLVVVMGDHGEGLMQHGHMHHGVHLYEEAVRVPLLLRWPARWATSRRVSTPVQLVDLGATLLHLVGTSAESTGARASGPAGGWARPGFPLESSDVAEGADRPVFLYRRHYKSGRIAGGVYASGEKFGVRLGRWKLIDGPDEGTLELFDLEADPAESTNLAGRRTEVVARLSDRLRAWRALYRAPAAGSERDSASPSDADRARLRALGYGD